MTTGTLLHNRKGRAATLRSRRQSRQNESTSLTGVEEQWPGSTVDDTSIASYERGFRVQTPVSWDIVERSQRDLLRLLIDRVPAQVGVGVILAVSTVFASHPKGEDAARAMLSTITSELPPPLSRTLLTTLADAQVTSESQPYDNRDVTIRSEMLRTTRRLLAADLTDPDRDALAFVQHVLSDSS